MGCGDDTTWNVTTTKCKTTCPDETLSDATSCSESSAENPPPTTTVGTTNIKNATTRCHIEDECGFDHEEESILIQIPLPGLVLKHRVEHSINKCSTENNPSTFTKTTMCTTTARIGTARLVPGFCTICLSGFTVGSNICWSSNSQCEHCFHCDCIEEWITKQLSSSKTNPVCPCCRRDFIVDSHDLSMPLSSPPPPVIIPTNTSTESLSTDQNSVTQDDIYDNDTSSIDQGTSNRPADRAEAEDFDIVVSLPVSLAGNNSRSISVENGSFEVQAQQNLGQQPTSSELSSHNVSGGDASDEESI